MQPHDGNDTRYTRHVVQPNGQTIRIAYLQPFGDEPEVRGAAHNSGELPSSPLLEALGTVLLGVLALFLEPATSDCEELNDAKPYICPRCTSDMVQPVGTPEPENDQFFTATLRCPDCEWYAEDVVIDNDAGERFNQHLDAGLEAIVNSLGDAEMWVMEDEVERFIGALNADAILPEDFMR
jgi:hypothetical protein